MGDLVRQRETGREGWLVSARDMEQAADDHDERIRRGEAEKDSQYDDSWDCTVQWDDGTRGHVDSDTLDEITPLVYVNVYLVDRQRGGPEEGGWYYDCGCVEESLRCKDEAHAQAVYERKLAEYAEENRNRRSDIGSVLSEGRFDVKLEAWPGENWPAVTPHYC